MGFNPGKLLKSFGYAFKGLKIVAGSQQNFWIHIIVACIVVICAILLKLNVVEWCIIVLCIFVVLALEILNTAIEKLVDFVSPGFHQQAGIVKDISAAAVFLAAIAAVIIGLIIFLPKIF